MKKFSFFIFLSVLISLESWAQRETVTLTLSSAKFDSFIALLEQQTPYTFYYDSRSTDSLLINIQASNLALKDVLEAVLQPAGLYFAPDSEKRIFITTDHAIITQFAYLKQAGSNQVRLEDYSTREKQADISIENQLFEIGDKSKPASGKTTLSGHVRFSETGGALSAVTVSVLGQPGGVQTDAFGYYSLTVPEKRSTIIFKRAGLQETSRQVLMHSSGKLDVQMTDQVFALNEVVVTGEMGSNINRTRMGLEKLSIKTIKQTPTVLGEADVINVILTLPGVQTVGEASSGFNVRGGATDQNLVLFGDATIFNSSHFFGMFSSFNADAVNQLELYKSSIPAKYGGRIASVLDVSTKQGNKKKLAGSGGIGLLTGRLSLEGPVGEKTAFLIGARSTYSDWLLKRIPNETYKNSSASFYDGQVIIDHEINEKNQLILTAYASQDNFGLSNGVQYGYGNKNLNLKWKFSVARNLYGVFALGTDNYDFHVGDQQTPLQTYDLQYKIGQEFARLDFSQNAGARHKLTYGLQALKYRVSPGTIAPTGEESLITAKTLGKEQALESAVYVADVFTVTDKLTLDLGARFSLYNYLGPRTVNYYLEGLARNENTFTGSEFFGKGKIIKTYNSPEIRAAVKYSFNDNSSVKLSYNSLRQYLHMLSNTTAITPTDSWKLSDSHIRPQFGDQVSLGYYQNLAKGKIETSAELYYKRINDYLDYKSGAKLLMNETIETDVISTQAKAYGAEFQIKKVSGKLNGWSSYTYSRILQRTTGTHPGEIINGGAYYPGNYDKPHSFTTVANYRFTHRFSLSAVTTYSTGRPITLPVGVFNYAGSERVFYSNRNEYRIPDYFRMDLSMNIEGNHKIKKLAHSSWTIGVYNLTGRKNPFSVYFLTENGKINGYKTSVLGTQLPFITYNFRF